jgi:predicted nucleic acid-binding protein
VTVVVLDAGAMIALERRDTRMLALADELQGARRIGYVPAGVVAQTWRGSARQHATVQLLRAGAVQVDPLSEDVAYRLGLLLAKSGTSDVVDAHVVLLARRLRAVVVTSDPDDLMALDPTLPLVTV